MRLKLALGVVLAALISMGAYCDDPTPPSTCHRTATTATFAAEYAATGSGQTLCLAAGSYGNVTIGKTLTLANLTQTRPTLTSLTITAAADGAKAHALNITGGGDPLVSIQAGAALVTVENSIIHDGSGNGVRNRGDYVTFNNNELYGFASEDAIRLWGDHHSYTNNFIHDVSNPGHNDAWQTYQTSVGDAPVTNLTIDNNTIEDFPGSNAHCIIGSGPNHTNWTITNNTFTNIGSHCTILGLHAANEGVANVQIHNNVYTNIGGTAIECNGDTFGSITNNTFNNVGGTVLHADNSNCTGQ